MNLIAIIMGFALYIQSANFDFSYDDYWQIHRNPLVTSSDMSLRSVAKILLSPTAPGNLYRPIPTITYHLQWHFSKENAQAFHMINIILYLMLLALACLTYNKFGSTVLSGAVALLLFATHPLHVEAVASVVGRAELLALVFALASFLAIERYATNNRIINLILGLLFYALAVMSKESAYIFAALIPLGLWYLSVNKAPGAESSQRNRILIAVAALAASTVSMIAVRFMVLGAGVSVSEATLGETFENPLATLAIGERLIPALAVFGEYILKLLAPFSLSADYSMTLESVMSKTYSLHGVAMMGVLIVFIILVRQQGRQASAFMGWWVPLTLLLTSNLFFAAGTIMGDRLALTASLGFCLFTTELVLARFPRFGLPILCALALAFAIQTYMRAPAWLNNLTLFRSMTVDNPSSPKAFFNYGIELATKGMDNEAESALRKSLELAPEHLPAMKAIADLLLKQRSYGRAEYFLRKILSREPENQQVIEHLRMLDSLKKP